MCQVVFCSTHFTGRICSGSAVGHGANLHMFDILLILLLILLLIVLCTISCSSIPNWCWILRLVTWTGFEFRILGSSPDAHAYLRVRRISLVGYMEPRSMRSILYVSSRPPVDQLPGTIVFLCLQWYSV